MSRKTDFFIVGAPKCGTTALAWYLNDREDVSITKPKEPHFFATDLPGYRAVTSESNYRCLYADAGDEQLIGDASVFHLYSKEALSNIHAYRPDAKIIVMLRNPPDVVQSFHSQLLYTRDEDESNFDTAWSLCADRREGLRVPDRCRAPELLSYDRIARFGEQLEEHVFFNFAPEQVCIILFDDFVTNTAAEFRRVLGFLGLPDEGREYFDRINPNRRHRSTFLADLLFNKSKLIRAPVSTFKRAMGIERIGLIKKLRKLETKYEEREPMSPELRNEILSVYSDDIERLARLIDRPLDAWLMSASEEKCIENSIA